MKDSGLEGIYHWRDINQNQDLKDLEVKMREIKYLKCMFLRVSS
jgi:hypothetical protein